MPPKRMVFHCWLHENRNLRFKVSHLCYAVKKHTQYQVVVKLLGSFRLTAPNRHLHRYCIFTKLVPETVSQSLHHSCASELHLRLPLLREGSDYIFISTLFAYLLLYIALIFESWHVIDYINNLSRSPLYRGDLSRYGVISLKARDFPRYSPYITHVI